LERATGIEPVLPAWESKFPLLYSHNLQKRSEKINVHALHTVHALPDLRIAGDVWGTVFSSRMVSTLPPVEGPPVSDCFPLLILKAAVFDSSILRKRLSNFCSGFALKLS
jgi:hypothetical protein